MPQQSICQRGYNMQLKSIKTENDYHQALHDLENLWEAEEGTEAFDHLEILSTLIEAYEEKVFPIQAPDPVKAIEFRMEQQGLSNKDMEQYLGSKSKVSEVLNYKRPLSINMIRRLASGLGMDPAILILEYPLKGASAA